MNDKKIKYIRIISAILAIAWMTVIFCFSAQDAGESGTTSMSVSYKIVVATDRLFGLDWADSRIMLAAAAIEEFVRKLAHMTEYAILAILLGVTFNIWEKNAGKAKTLTVLIICAVYAASDEIHQLYVPGRFGCVKDVIIDLCGSAFAVFITLRLKKVLSPK